MSNITDIGEILQYRLSADPSEFYHVAVALTIWAPGYLLLLTDIDLRRSCAKQPGNASLLNDGGDPS
jgi:hypothetical protein